MGTRQGHRPMAPPSGRGHPAHRGAFQNWGAVIRRCPVPAGRHPGALAPHAPPRPCSRAAPGARQLRRAARGVGGSHRRHPTGPPPPGRRKRVRMGYAGAQPHRAPRVHGNPHPGATHPAWNDLIPAFHDHGILPEDTWREVQRKTLGRDYRRRVRASLLEIWDPLQQRWDDLLLCHLDPWSPPSNLSHTCRLCGECDTVSSAATTGANKCARCAQVAACPWPEPPAGPGRRTEGEALHQRSEGTHAPSHERAGPAGAALLWIHVHLRDPTSVAHLSHVFAP